jgi:ribokinase
MANVEESGRAAKKSKIEDEADAANRPIITVIGSLNTDLVSRTSRMPGPGETLTGKSFSTGSGGKGGNQVVACARLSRNLENGASISNGVVDVRMIGAVGDDEFGKTLIGDLESNHVDASGVRVVAGTNSGVAVITVEEENGQNRILLSPGANYQLRPEHFTVEALQGLSRPSLPDLIVLQLEIPLDTTLQILDTAAELNVPVLFNPAPALEIPLAYYPKIAHLILNETEAEMLSGVQPILPDGGSKSATGSKSTRDSEALEKAVGIFRERGVKNVVITLGEFGSAYGYDNAEGSKFLWSPTTPVKVVDSTAAGDTFIGAYAVATVQRPNQDLQRRVHWASQCAGLTVTKEGAQKSIPWANEVELPSLL